jgi:hypothetical protein
MTPNNSEVDPPGKRDHRGRDRRRLPPVAQHYLVDVEGVEGGRVDTITAAMPAEALDAYLHPFARQTCDIFSDDASLRE